MTAEQLQSHTLKDLAEMAKARGVPGWHAMRKGQLVKALLKVLGTAGRKPSRRGGGASSNGAASGPRAVRPCTGRSASRQRRASPVVRSAGKAKSRTVSARQSASGASSTSSAGSRRRRGAQRKLEEARIHHELRKNLASASKNGDARDRLVVLVRDAYWLFAHWEIARSSVERAKVALGQDWHGARPVLRVYQVASDGTTSTAEVVLRDIEIHGGVSNWYVDVPNPPNSYRLGIGYLTSGGKFYVLARSNIVHTPAAGACDALDENWHDVARNFQKIYALNGGNSPEGMSADLQQLFEERLRMPMNAPVLPAADSARPAEELKFEVDAELIVYGRAEPGTQVTLQGDPVELRQDGTFTVRFQLPNCRQVIPAVASTRDGTLQRTIVLAVERNTKVLEPLIRDVND
jgi:hypothetical protein